MLFPGCGELDYAAETGIVSLEATVSLFCIKILLCCFFEEYNGIKMLMGDFILSYRRSHLLLKMTLKFLIPPRRVILLRREKLDSHAYLLRKVCQMMRLPSNILSNIFY